MSERQPLRGPALFVASLLFLLGLISFVVGWIQFVVGNSLAGGLCILASVLAFGFLLNALSGNTGRS